MDDQAERAAGGDGGRRLGIDEQLGCLGGGGRHIDAGAGSGGQAAGVAVAVSVKPVPGLARVSFVKVATPVPVVTGMVVVPPRVLLAGLVRAMDTLPLYAVSGAFVSLYSTSAVRPNGMPVVTVAGGWAVITSLVSRATWPTAPELSVNQTLPSGPVVIPEGAGVGTCVEGGTVYVEMVSVAELDST